jgi:phage shock protein A
MSESIARRVGRLVSGGFNAIVDAVENAAPETVMDQAIREVEDAIADVRVELGKVMANKHLASSRLMEENRKHEEMAENIRLAVDQGRDDLAETAIAQQMDIEAQIPVLESAISDAGVQERELEGYVRALQAKRREMEAELDGFRASRASATLAGAAGAGSAAGQDRHSGTAVDGKVERAGAAFDRIIRRVGGVPGPSGAADRKSATQLAELDDLARRNRVKERLAQVKAESKIP